MEAVVDLRIATEHMEEDENTPKSLPRWVELEYMVRSHKFFVAPASV